MKKIELTHRPEGDHHPYVSAADERIPRYPLSGESISLGVLSRSKGQCPEVFVEYWVEGGTKQSVKAKSILDGTEMLTSTDAADEGHLAEAVARAGLVTDADHWVCEIPAFVSGEEFSYRFYSFVNQDKKNYSEIFSYYVPTIVRFDKASRYWIGDEFIAIALIDEAGTKENFLLVELAADDQLKFSLINALPEHLEEGNSGIKTERTAEILRHDISSTLVLEVQMAPFSLSVRHQAGFYYLKDWGDVFARVNKEGLFIDINFANRSPKQEAFYGFGERFNALNQRGEELDIRVYEEYKNQGKRTYLPASVYLSSLQYGIYYETSRKLDFDLASSDPEFVRTKAQLGSDQTLSWQFISNEPDGELLDIVSRLTLLTGKPVLPPDWVFGLWISANEWNSQKRVEEIITRHLELEIPVSVIVLEAWSDENTFYIWNEAKYEPISGKDRFSYDEFSFDPDGLWPDPKGMIDWLHSLNIKILLWQIPVLKDNEDNHAQLENDSQHMLNNRYFVQESDGTPYKIRPFWFRNGMVMDFTSAEGSDWWMDKRRYLIEELGVDGFKTDGGEHLWGENLHFSDERNGDEGWNEYPNLYAEAYHKYARKINPDAITFSRAGYTGAQKFPCHWAGDENSSWQAFRSSILAGLSAGISGIPFWTWDMAGFSGPLPDSELYLRAAAQSIFTPLMQYHAEYNHHHEPLHDRTPWNIQQQSGDDRVVDLFRDFVETRKRLLPYILKEAKKSSENGVPMMRALPLMFNNDLLSEFPYQYMFGDDLLVAPIVEEGIETWDIALPEGKWTCFWSGKVYSGDKIYSINVPLSHIPVFVREGVNIV